VSEPQPPVIVEERHLTLDERIQSDVMDKLAAAPYISGKIGVESHDATVRLTGYTMTAGQAYRAGRYAGSVVGVKYVHNDIRPRIGGSI
jgi:osmotically-inducible protein OsmY